MFLYARSEQRDLVPIYTITNTQRIRIYLGKLKFILVNISSARGQRKPNSVHVSYCSLFTRVQIRSVFKFVQLWVNVFARWYKRVAAYLGNLIFIHLFCVLIFILIDPNLRIASKRIKLIRTNIYKVLQFIRVNLPIILTGLNWRPNLSFFFHLKMIKSCSFTSFLSHFFMFL